MVELISPELPPLMSARAVAGDPFAAACLAAAGGCDAGLVLHDAAAADSLSAALVLAPEVPLRRACAMLPLAGVGLQNALGALSPPEVGVQLRWDGTVIVNGAAAGRLRIAAGPGQEPGELPDWLVVGWRLALTLPPDDPGRTPDRTALSEEGCADIPPVTLLEAWCRHTLVWLHRWEDEGNAPLHAEWSGLVADLDGPLPDDAPGAPGILLGTDEDFGLLVRDGDATRVVPLSWLLADHPASKEASS